MIKFKLQVIIVLVQTLFYTSAYSSTCHDKLVPRAEINIEANRTSPKTLLSSSSAVATLESTEVLKNPPLSIRYFLDSASAKFKSLELQPTFINPRKEERLSKKWGGTTDVPQMIKDTLITQKTSTGSHSTSVIDFSLLAADKGTVKTATPGSFISLRWNELWNGKDMSTNMGVYAPTLVKAAMEKEHSYLISSDVKAVFIFLHGGGTATTGHHVANSISNFLGPKGVSVISIDAPFHGYGPREEISPEDYYRYLKDIRYKLAPSDTPVFIGGHSMGGLHADNLMRMSQEFGIGEAFEGFISLSTPLDEAPGQDQKTKEASEKKIMEDPKVLSMILDSEVDLNVDLFLQGKIAPGAGISTSHFFDKLDWTIPEHKGADWPESLYLMGRYDALYLGREDNFQRYVTDLENTEVHIMDERIDHYGALVKIGHMIFDHRLPDSESQPESFSRIRDFIGRVIGEDLSEIPKDYTVGEQGLATNMIIEYYTNLAFRVYLSEYKFFEVGTFPAVKAINDQAKKLGTESKVTRNLIKKEQDPEKKAELVKKLSSIEAEFKRLNSYLRRVYVPELGSGNHEFAIQNIADRDEADENINATTKRRKFLKPEILRVTEAIVKAKKRLDQNSREILRSENLEEIYNSQELQEKVTELNQFTDELVEFYLSIDAENSEYASEQIKNRSFSVNPPAELIEKYVKLKGMHGKYIELENRILELIQLVMSEDNDQNKPILALYGSANAFKEGVPEPESLLALELDLVSESEKLISEASRYTDRKALLIDKYIKKILPEYYSSYLTSGLLKLDVPIEESASIEKTLAVIWSRWYGKSGIRRARPPEEKTSLY